MTFIFNNFQLKFKMTLKTGKDIPVTGRGGP
jgi:hypothetical protein